VPGSPSGQRKIVIVSGVHDYRTPRRGSIQALADALVRLGDDVTFISLRFSQISRVKGDHRLFLWSRANRPETVNGVRCYLWRTPFHPFRCGVGALDSAAGPMFSAYASLPNRFIDGELRSASHIVVESGLGIAEKMAADFAWAAEKTFVVPLGIHGGDFAAIRLRHRRVQAVGEFGLSRAVELGYEKQSPAYFYAVLFMMLAEVVGGFPNTRHIGVAIVHLFRGYGAH
jgi:glucuronosyltransferase GumK-like protein